MKFFWKNLIFIKSVIISETFSRVLRPNPKFLQIRQATQFLRANNEFSGQKYLENDSHIVNNEKKFLFDVYPHFFQNTQFFWSFAYGLKYNKLQAKKNRQISKQPTNISARQFWRNVFWIFFNFEKSGGKQKISFFSILDMGVVSKVFLTVEFNFWSGNCLKSQNFEKSGREDPE